MTRFPARARCAHGASYARVFAFALLALACVLLQAAPAAAQFTPLRDAYGRAYVPLIGKDSSTGLPCDPGPSNIGTCVVYGISGGGGGGGGDASAANQVTGNASLASILATLGAAGDTACATDNGSCSVTALIKRMNQRETSLITALGSPFQAGGSIGNTGFAAYGPTAKGSPASNPPVLLGGTVDGGATGNVGVAKVTSDGLVHVAVDSGGGTGGTSSTYGAAFPATGTAIGAKSGANMVNLAAGTGNSLLSQVVDQAGAVLDYTVPALVNETQVNGVTLATGNGVAGTGVQRVAIASDNTAFPVNATLAAGSALAGGVNLVDTAGTNKATVKAASTSAATTDTALVVMLSPTPSPVCTSSIAINQTASTDLVTSVAKLNICSIVLVSATAQNLSLVEGTGTVCATGSAALIGGTTASLAVAANGGFSAVDGRTWLKTKTTADHLCLLQSGAGNVSGIITYADAS